jgi:hypothetical protein
VVASTYGPKNLASPVGEGNGDDDEPVERDEPIELDTSAIAIDTDDDERPLDVAVAIEPPEFDADWEDDGLREQFTPALCAPEPGDDGDDASVEVPTAGLLSIAQDEGDDEGGEWPEFDFALEAPATSADDDAPFQGEELVELAPELPHEPRFAVDWQDSEAARQLVAVGRGFASLGKECRQHTLAGDIVQRYPLPHAFTRAALVLAATAAFEHGSPLQMVCVAGGRLLRWQEDHWSRVSDDGCLGEAAFVNVVQRREQVLVGTTDNLWFSLEGGALRQAFGGRPVQALCPAERWLGCCQSEQGPQLVELEGETARPLCASPSSTVVRMYSRERYLVVEDTGRRRWLVTDERRVAPILGAARFAGTCLGERDGKPKLWTTTEVGSALGVVEVDLEAGSQSVVGLLPWTTSDEDTPTVFDMLWLDHCRRLIVASDYGVVALRLLEDAPSSELGPPERAVS